MPICMLVFFIMLAFVRHCTWPCSGSSLMMIVKLFRSVLLPFYFFQLLTHTHTQQTGPKFFCFKGILFILAIPPHLHVATKLIIHRQSLGRTTTHLLRNVPFSPSPTTTPLAIATFWMTHATALLRGCR